MQPSSIPRQVALGAVVFGATLLLLLGFAAILAQRSGDPVGGSPSAAAASPTPGSHTPPPSSAPSIPSPSPSVTTPTPAPTPIADPVLVGAGDIAECDSEEDEATADLLDAIEGTVYTLGDNVYPSASEETLRDCFGPSWGRHLDRMLPVAGNHDWQDGGIKAYRVYFGERLPADGLTWYATWLGSWRVVVLDSDCDEVEGCGPDSAQGRWLADELAANQADCTVALFHHPRFSSGDEHGDDPAMDAFWQPLYTAGVDVILNGHEHDYERFAPQDPDAREDRGRGIRQFVVGTGGTTLRGFDDPRPNSELRANIAHGVLALTLRDGSYDWRFHAADSDFGDAGTGPCH